MQASGDRTRQRQYPPVGRRWHSQQTCAAANVLQSEVASATDSDDPVQPLADGDDALEEPGAACRHAADKLLLTQATRSKRSCSSCAGVGGELLDRQGYASIPMVRLCGSDAHSPGPMDAA